MRYFLDTNFVYAVFSPNDSIHEKAKVIFDSEVDKNDIIISMSVVAELMSSKTSVNFLNICMSMTGGVLLNPIIDDLQFIDNHILPQTRSTLKANDCLIMAMSIRLGARLMTFDKKLQKAYNKLKNIKL